MPTKTRSRSSTSSRRGARTARKPLKPFTIDHFRRYASQLVLDNGDAWHVEDFQVAVLEDLFAGTPEVWMVVPEGNGKTTLMSGVALYYGDYTDDAAVLLAAASRDQCGLLFGQAAGFVRRSALTARFRVYEGYRRINCKRSTGTIQVFAADDRTGDGVIPTLALLDELHRHRTLDLYRTWRGKLGKRDGQICAISTAGEPGSEFEDVRARARTDALEVQTKGCYTRAVCEELVLHEHALLPTDDPEDLKLVKRANPFSGVTVETLRRKRASPSMTHWHWLRFVCNVATAGEDAWLPPAEWDACEEPGVQIPDGAPVMLGVDIGTKKDSSAVVRVWQREDGRVVPEATILTPSGDGTALELARVEHVIGEDAVRYDVRGVVYDRWAFEKSAQDLSDRGLLMIEEPMSQERMTINTQNLYEAIISRQIAHGGDPELRAHVVSGATKPTERGVRLVKNKAKRPIDALIALTLAYSQVTATQSVYEQRGLLVL